jgi:hypothetical protein
VTLPAWTKSIHFFISSFRLTNEIKI